MTPETKTNKVSVRPSRAIRAKGNPTPRVLFLLKFRNNPQHFSDALLDPEYVSPLAASYGLSSGLLNSAKFVVDMLGAANFNVKLVQVVDNNAIDREVHNYKPTHVIIEALWVVPEKFLILQRLHPTVKWIVRGHSELPFLANEGVAIKWLTQYTEFENVSFAANSLRSYHDIRTIIGIANPTMTERELCRKILLLPNYYPTHRRYRRRKREDQHLDVACFGAIRPLKNQLIQAIAAHEYAVTIDKNLRFHINASRTEQKGDNVLKNLRALFKATGHELIEHGWMPHREFMWVLEHMDVAMQVSFTESFNIVAADCVVVGLPIVGSQEVSWLVPWVKAEPTDSKDIVRKMTLANGGLCKWLFRVLNLMSLRRYCAKSREHWLSYFDR